MGGKSIPDRDQWMFQLLINGIQEPDEVGRRGIVCLEVEEKLATSGSRSPDEHGDRRDAIVPVPVLHHRRLSLRCPCASH